MECCVTLAILVSSLLPHYDSFRIPSGNPWDSIVESLTEKSDSGNSPAIYLIRGTRKQTV